jgi:type II secretory pathway component PulF
MGRLCRLLGMMLQSGVTLVDSLRLARSATGSFLFREMFTDIERCVVNGGRMADCLERHDFLPDSAADMLRTAEQSGNLGSVALMIGEHYEEEGESKLKELVTVLEPAITVGMGVVVAVVVLAVMLPMFDLTTFAQKGTR